MSDTQIGHIHNNEVVVHLSDVVDNLYLPTVVVADLQAAVGSALMVSVGCPSYIIPFGHCY